MHDLTLEEEPGRLVLPAYPFPQRRRVVLEVAHIREVIDWGQPSIRTMTGDFLFAPREGRDRLKAFCVENGLPFVGGSNRYDAWGHIVDPFLDTVHSEEMQAGTMRLLARHGFDAAEVETLRVRVEKPMLRLTAITWEWMLYGLYDVLLALDLRGPFGRAMSPGLYAEVMAIAERGCTAEG